MATAPPSSAPVAPTRRFELIVETGSDAGRTIELDPNRRHTLGRTASCDIVVPDSKVSKVSCLFEPIESGFEIVDRSRNGTYVGRRRVSTARLRNRDRITVGTTKLEYRVRTLDERVGTKIGGYEIVERLGQGGMGAVYRAVQPRLGREVALKVIAPRLSGDPAFLAQLLREARSLARLAHPRVVGLHTVGRADDEYFLVLELVDGGHLLEAIDRAGRLSIADGLRVARDACDALVWAERAGIIHRDLKPSNLLLGPDGRVKIADFGLAIDAETDAGPRRQAQGSPQYMAPEQCAGQAVDHRADLYGLGSTLYVALSGSVPWPNLDADGVRAAKRAGRRTERLSSRCPDLPQTVCEIVDRLMAPRPDDRFGTARELLETIDRVIAQLEGRAHAPSAWPLQRTKRTPNERRRIRFLAAGVAIVVVAAALVTARISRYHDDAGAPTSNEESSNEPRVEAPLEENATTATVTAPPSDTAVGEPPRQSLFELLAPGTLIDPPSERSDDATPIELSLVLASDASIEPADAPESLLDAARRRRDRAELERFSSATLEPLLLEGSFERASRSIDAFLSDHSEFEASRDDLEERLASARVAFEARADALRLESSGERDAAIEVLRRALDGPLTDADRELIDRAIEAIGESGTRERPSWREAPR